MDKKYNIGFASVVGDFLHAGHLKMLEEAKSNCEYLIVGLICDPSDRPYKNIPIETVYERYIRLSSTKYADEIIPLQNESDLKLFFEMAQNIDVRFVGEDYRGQDFTAKELCIKNGIDIYYCKRRHNISSTNIRERIINAK